METDITQLKKTLQWKFRLKCQYEKNFKTKSALQKNSFISSREFYVNVLFYFLKTLLPKLKKIFCRKTPIPLVRSFTLKS